MGGTHSPLLSTLAVEVWNWCIERNLTIHAQHLPGVENAPADWESRHRTDSSDWKLNRDMSLQLENKLGPFSVDMFASRTNAQLPHCSSCDSRCFLNLVEGSPPIHVPTICPHSSLLEQAPGRRGDSNLDSPSGPIRFGSHSHSGV